MNIGYETYGEYNGQIVELNPLSAEVGMGVTHLLHTDTHAYQITKVLRNGKTLEVKQMDAEADFDAWTPNWISGGFSSICTNPNEQKWKLVFNPENATQKINWSNKYKRYHIHGMGRISRSIGARERYDYNF